MENKKYIINADVVVIAKDDKEAKELFLTQLGLPEDSHSLSTNLVSNGDKDTVILSVTNRLYDWELKDKALTEADIINSVSSYTGVSREEMETGDRNRYRVRARCMVYAEVLRVLDYSLAEAGAIFNQDHSTAYDAKMKLTGKVYNDTKYYNKYLQTLNY